MGGVKSTTIKLEAKSRVNRGKVNKAKKVTIAKHSSKSSILNKEDTVSRLIHPNVSRCYNIDCYEAINKAGEIESNQVWKLEFKANKSFLSYTAEFPHFRKKLLTDVLKGLVYLHENKLIHGELDHRSIVIGITDDGPRAIITFKDIFKKQMDQTDQINDLQDWGHLVCEVYTGKANATSDELPQYMKRFVESCFQSSLLIKNCNAKAVLQMIEEEDAQIEMDVQLAESFSTDLPGMYNKLNNRYSKSKAPKGLLSNFKEFRRY